MFELTTATVTTALVVLLVAGLVVGIAATWVLGLYDAPGALTLSVVGVVPGLAGVAVGSRLRPRISETRRTAGTLLLLAVIGVRLATGG